MIEIIALITTVVFLFDSIYLAKKLTTAKTAVHHSLN
jgi:hypothetical protein